MEQVLVAMEVNYFVNEVVVVVVVVDTSLVVFDYKP